MENNENLNEQANMGPESRHELDPEQSKQWDENHKTIMACIRAYMQRNYETPTIVYISDKTGLSRPTVRKHIRGFSSQPDFVEHASIFKLMATDIFRQLYTQAMQEDVRAARLYMELIGVLKYNTLAEGNFVYTPPKRLMIDGNEITEELLKSLPPDLYQRLDETMREVISTHKIRERLTLPQNGKS